MDQDARRRRLGAGRRPRDEYGLGLDGFLARASGQSSRHRVRHSVVGTRCRHGVSQQRLPRCLERRGLRGGGGGIRRTLRGREQGARRTLRGWRNHMRACTGLCLCRGRGDRRVLLGRCRRSGSRKGRQCRRHRVRCAGKRRRCQAQEEARRGQPATECSSMGDSSHECRCQMRSQRHHRPHTRDLELREDQLSKLDPVAPVSLGRVQGEVSAP